MTPVGTRRIRSSQAKTRMPADATMRSRREGASLKTSVKTVTVHTERTFAIARSSADAFERVIFEIEEDGVVGLGEAAPTSYYGQDAEGTAAALKRVEVMDPWDIEGTLAHNDELPPSALTALDKELGNFRAMIGFDNAMAHLIEAGADLFLAKPVNLRELTVRARQLIARFRGLPPPSGAALAATGPTTAPSRKAAATAAIQYGRPETRPICGSDRSSADGLRPGAGRQRHLSRIIC